MENLRDIRKRKGLTVGQLSGRTGIPVRVLLDYEEGLTAIPPAHLARLAKALFVGIDEIRPLSKAVPREAPPAVPRPPEPPFERRREERPPAPGRPPAGRPGRPPREKKAPPPPGPARPSQVNHLIGLSRHFGWDLPELEAKIGKPLAGLNRREASQWLTELQQQIAAEAPSKPPAAGPTRHRAHLPEAVDGYELAYLTRQQTEGTTLTFTMFNGETFTGRVIGFSPYSITIQDPAGSEVTLQKLAIAHYRRLAEGGGA
jgi:transcriptional regulator with XRE-family HTH domain